MCARARAHAAFFRARSYVSLRAYVCERTSVRARVCVYAYSVTPGVVRDAHTGWEASERARGIVGRMLRASTPLPALGVYSYYTTPLSSIYMTTIYTPCTLFPPSLPSLPFPFPPSSAFVPLRPVFLPAPPLACINFFPTKRPSGISAPFLFPSPLRSLLTSHLTHTRIYILVLVPAPFPFASTSFSFLSIFSVSSFAP